MKIFLKGLITGIIVTTCFFIFYPSLKSKSETTELNETTVQRDSAIVDTSTLVSSPVLPIETKSITTNRDSIVAFAKTLLGVPYLYASTDPAKGFDCSGFINYVFHHFNISVPRSSYEFEKIGQKVTLDQCQKGDLILFTGTDSLEKNIGHIGIVIDSLGQHPLFIHSSSGKANGVTITSIESKYYQKRFVTVVDILSN